MFFLLVSIYVIFPAALGPGVHSGPLTEICIKSREIMLLGSRARSVRRADNLTAISEPVV
jgi:hypothetical protein